MASNRQIRCCAFTLVELLVSVSIIALLVGILLPSLAGAREQARTVACGSNIRQVFAASAMYAGEYRDHYVPGASNFLENLHRWHGTRTNPAVPFDPARGPLVPYLGPDGAIRRCPTQHVDLPLDDPRRFERGSGGYGYNNAFLGRRLRSVGFGFHAVETDRVGAKATHVDRPADTAIFADAAFVNGVAIDYSFIEPRFHPTTQTRADPSIHFRHRGQANVAWCDGHIDTRRRTFTWTAGLYHGDPDRLNIGWFGQTDDNRLFDLD